MANDPSQMIARRLDETNGRLDQVNQRLDQGFAGVDRRFEAMDRRFDAHEEANAREFRNVAEAIAEVRTAVAGHIGQLRIEMVQRFDGVDKRLDGMDQRFDRMDRRFDRVEDKLDRALAARSRPVRKRRANGK